MTSIGRVVCSKDDFVYEMNWNEEVATFFIKHFSGHAPSARINYGNCLLPVMRVVQEELQKQFGMFFSLRDLRKHLSFMDERYTIFHWLVNQPGVFFLRTS